MDFGMGVGNVAKGAWDNMNTLQKVGVAPIPVVSDIAGLLGDAQMMYEQPEERTLANAGFAALGALPFVPAGLGTIGGKAAKNLNPETLELAETMKSNGASRDEIWKATGEQFGQPAYFDPVDGSFRFEIDDSQAKLTSGYKESMKEGSPYFRGQAGGFFDHPELVGN